MMRVGGNLPERLRRGFKEDGVDGLLVLESEGGHLVRYGENHMEILDRKKLPCPLGEPLLTSRTLALRTMPVPARVVGDLEVATAIALLDVSAQGGGTATGDIA